LQAEEKVVLEASDTLLSSVIDETKSQPKIETVINVLQQGLRMKQPMVAGIGGNDGLRLSRAAFGTMLKFCDKLEVLLKLTEDVHVAANSIGEAEQGD